MHLKHRCAVAARSSLPHIVAIATAVQACLLAAPACAVEHAEICRYCRDAAAAEAAAAEADASAVRNYAPDRQVDVQHIKLEVTPNFDSRTVAGTATLKFAPIARPLESLRLDGVNLKIREVRSSHKVREWSADAENVTIAFDEPVPVDADAYVEIEYSAEPVEGLYFRTPEMGFPESDSHCWTQGETHEARHWFPCFDYPNERSSTELVCRVPADMTVVSNGRLVSEQEGDDGRSRTFHWLQEKPHVSYLICFVAGRLEKLEARHRNVPLGFYSQPSRAKYAVNAFRDTADIMSFFEKEIGVDFPWEKYDQCTISDFMFGGMENTTITTLTQRTVFDHANDDAAAARARSLNAHEMAHQWFGDYVTCKDWSHLWLNEGFATYYTHLYEGHKSGREAMLYRLYQDAKDDILSKSSDARPIVFRGYKDAMEQFDFRSYPKGSWVLHMLRCQLGEELYRQAIHTYLERHALSSVESDDLREVFEELSGKPLDRFFDQWLYHGGFPELTVTHRWLAKERLAHVTVKQAQTVGDDVLLFEFPTKLRFIVDGKSIDEAIVIKNSQHDFFVPLPAAPQVVRFDPELTVLAKITFDKSDAMTTAQLENKDDAIGRVLACEELAKKGKNGAVAALKKALQNDEFYGVREAAARALREIGTEDAVDALADSGDQDDVRVRRRVVEELGKCYRDSAHDKLRHVAADEDELPTVAAAAIAALGRASGEATSDAIREALESRSFNNERFLAAVQAIRDLNDADFFDDLTEALEDRGGELGPTEMGEGFRALAAVSQRGRRRAAAYDFLTDYLDHPRLGVQAAAIAALGELRDPRARTILEPFTAEGQHARVRAAARGALAALDRNADLAPEEVGELRRELRELREEYQKLEKTVEELKSKSNVESKDSSTDSDDGDDSEGSTVEARSSSDAAADAEEHSHSEDEG